jgi:zinc transport system substrate-binding protein
MGLKLIKIIITIFIILIPLSGCNADEATKLSSGGQKFTIVTSFYPIYIDAINVTKGVQGVKVVNMTGPQTGCLHDYTLSAENMKTLSEAQVFIINGAGMEDFMDKVIKQLPNLKIIESAEGIELIEDQQKDNGNPHVWVSISNAIQQMKTIGAKLAEIDSANAGIYKSNTEEYVKKLELERTKMHNVLDNVTNKDIVTFHEAFPYFAKEFNLNIVTVIEREPGSEPSAKELETTIETIKARGVKTLFAEPQYSSKAAQTIASETGAKIYILDPVVTGKANGDMDAYIKAMDNNLEVLKEALNSN